MTKEERHTYWKRLVDEQTASGSIASVFCREHNLKISQFCRWRRKFQNTGHDKSSNGFIQLIPETRSSCSGISIRISDDLLIELDRDFDPVTLRTTVKALCYRS